jgi:hypothetical protein
LAGGAQRAATFPQDALTVDLRDIFVCTGGSDVDTVVSSLATTPDEEPMHCTTTRSDDVIEDDEAELGMLQRYKAVAAGWENKFSNTRKQVGRDQDNDPGAMSLKGKAKVGFVIWYFVHSWH